MEHCIPEGLPLSDTELCSWPGDPPELFSAKHSRSASDSWTYIPALDSPNSFLSYDFIAQGSFVSNSSTSSGQVIQDTQPHESSKEGSPFTVVSVDSSIAHYDLSLVGSTSLSPQPGPIPQVLSDPGSSYQSFTSGTNTGDHSGQFSGTTNISGWLSGSFGPFPEQPPVPFLSNDFLNWEQDLLFEQQLAPEFASAFIAQGDLGHDPFPGYHQQTIISPAWPLEQANFHSSEALFTPLEQASVSQLTPFPETGTTLLTDINSYPNNEQPSMVPDSSQSPWNHLGLVDVDVHPQAPGSKENQSVLRSTKLASRPRPLARLAPKSSIGIGRVRQEKRRSAVPGVRSGSFGDQKRREIAKVRANGACWICAHQKDPCKGDMICKRCELRDMRGQPNLLGCIRTHLKDMTTTFLPLSMTTMHQRDVVISYVQERAIAWSEESRGIEVYLNTGFGPPFKWLLHEFEPAWPELLLREQWENDNDGRPRLITKSSPPLGVRKLVEEDGGLLGGFVTNLILRHLGEFQNTCFKDEDPFKSKVVRLLCSLYNTLPNGEKHKHVRSDLEQVLKMLAVTLIMTHTIDIDQTHRRQVLTKLSKQNDPDAYPESVSPWMASMQLKCFFARLRTKLYSENLNRLQQILHNPVKKYPRICALVLILGLGLGLEECQYLLLIQAEGRLNRREEDDEWVARKKAREQCAKVDEGFDFIRNVFHCRYSTGKLVQRADLNEWVKQSDDVVEIRFVCELLDLFKSEQNHLQSVRNLELGSAEEDNHSSRLLARFMLDVM